MHDESTWTAWQDVFLSTASWHSTELTWSRYRLDSGSLLLKQSSGKATATKSKLWNFHPKKQAANFKTDILNNPITECLACFFACFRNHFRGLDLKTTELRIDVRLDSLRRCIDLQRIGIIKYLLNGNLELIRQQLDLIKSSVSRLWQSIQCPHDWCKNPRHLRIPHQERSSSRKQKINWKRRKGNEGTNLSVIIFKNKSYQRQVVVSSWEMDLLQLPYHQRRVSNDVCWKIVNPQTCKSNKQGKAIAYKHKYKTVQKHKVYHWPIYFDLSDGGCHSQTRLDFAQFDTPMYVRKYLRILKSKP